MEDELGNIFNLYQTAGPIADLQEEKARYILGELAPACTRIIAQIHPSVSPGSHNKTPMPIVRYQKLLCILDNGIWEEIEHIDTSKQQHPGFSDQFVRKFSGELLTVIRKMRKFYPEEFDRLYPAPILQLESDAGRLNKKLAELSSGASEEQMELLSILKTIMSYSYLKSIKAGFFHLEFLEEMLAVLSAIKEPSDSKLTRWMSLMIEYGLNSPAFYSYCCMEIMRRHNRCQDIFDSYSVLYWIKKKLQQLVPWTKISFHSTLPDIKSSLLNFVDAEISHLQSLEKIGGDLATYGQMDQNFRVSFSVKELAYFIHLQVQCGIILEEKPKKIHQYVVGHYNTRETEKISEKSFKNASYSRYQNNVSKVMTKLSEMIALAQGDL